MQRTVPTPIDRLVANLPETARVFVLGCGGCATDEGYGTPEACRETAEALAEHGVVVVGHAAPAAGEALCNRSVARRVLSSTDATVRADTLVVLACARAEPVLDGLFDGAIVSGVQTIVGDRTGGGARAIEDCNFCAEGGRACIASLTGGLCPHAFCPKGLINGPCGGAQAGRCEAMPNRPCVWELIHRRLKAAGRLDALATYHPPVSYRIAGSDES